jgi:hypothetical protein
VGGAGGRRRGRGGGVLCRGHGGSSGGGCPVPGHHDLRVRPSASTHPRCRPNCRRSCLTLHSQSGSEACLASYKDLGKTSENPAHCTKRPDPRPMQDGGRGPPTTNHQPPTTTYNHQPPPTNHQPPTRRTEGEDEADDGSDMYSPYDPDLDGGPPPARALPQPGGMPPAFGMVGTPGRLAESRLIWP